MFCIKVYLLLGLTSGAFQKKNDFRLGLLYKTGGGHMLLKATDVHIPFYDYSSIIKRPFINLGFFFLSQEKPKWEGAKGRPPIKFLFFILCRKQNLSRWIMQFFVFQQNWIWEKSKTIQEEGKTKTYLLKTLFFPLNKSEKMDVWVERDCEECREKVRTTQNLCTAQIWSESPETLKAHIEVIQTICRRPSWKGALHF